MTVRVFCPNCILLRSYIICQGFFGICLKGWIGRTVPTRFAVSGKNGKLNLPAVLFDHFGKKADAPLKGGVLFRCSFEQNHDSSNNGLIGGGCIETRCSFLVLANMRIHCVHTYMCTKLNVCVYVCTQRIAEILTYREFQINGLSSEQSRCHPSAVLSGSLSTGLMPVKPHTRRPTRFVRLLECSMLYFF